MTETDATLTGVRVQRPATEGGGRALPKWAGLVVAVIVPLLFVAMIAIAYISAFHHPAPYRTPIAIVGAEQVTNSIVENLKQASPDAFDVTSETNLDPALKLLHSREVIGVIEIGVKGITAHTAVAAGNGTAATVTATANSLAKKMGLPVTTINEVPTTDGDSTGIALFYLMMICTIGAYIAVMVLPGVAGNMKLGGRFAFVGVIAVLVPAVAYALASVFVGNFGFGAGGITVLLSISALYTFTVGTLALFAEQLIGQASMLLTMTLIMVLNLPSSGGPMAAAVLPPFWQWMHSFWFGSAALESMRNLAYFPDAPIAGHLLALSIWAVAAVAGVLAVAAIKRSRTPRVLGSLEL